MQRLIPYDIIYVSYQTSKRERHPLQAVLPWVLPSSHVLGRWLLPGLASADLAHFRVLSTGATAADQAYCSQKATKCLDLMQVQKVPASRVQVIGGHEQLQAQLCRKVHVRHVPGVLVLLVVVEVLAHLFQHDAAVANSLSTLARILQKSLGAKYLMFSKTTRLDRASEKLSVLPSAHVPRYSLTSQRSKGQTRTERIQHSPNRTRHLCRAP